MKVVMQPEPERKFKVPPEMAAFVLHDLQRILKSLHYTYGKVSSSQRRVTYLDSSDWQVLLHDQTIRVVEGFDNGKVRHDYKAGKGDTRLEGNIWKKKPLDMDAILGYAPPELTSQWTRLIGMLVPVANVQASHVKMAVKKKGWTIEAKIDHYTVRDGVPIHELELEVTKAENLREAIRHRDRIARSIEQGMGLEPVEDQKYCTIILGMPKYEAKMRELGLAPARTLDAIALVGKD